MILVPETGGERRWDPASGIRLRGNVVPLEVQHDHDPDELCSGSQLLYRAIPISPSSPTGVNPLDGGSRIGWVISIHG